MDWIGVADGDSDGIIDGELDGKLLVGFSDGDALGEIVGIVIETEGADVGELTKGVEEGNIEGVEDGFAETICRMQRLCRELSLNVLDASSSALNHN